MAAQESSFDIVSEVDLNEVKNAFNQATKELEHRYDFRGSNAKIEFDGEALKLTAEDEFRLGQVRDIVFSKLVKREIDPKMVEYGKVEPGAGISVHQSVSFRQGINQDQAKSLAKQVKDHGLKVHAQVQGDRLRVSGKSKDDLQKAIQFVKGLDLPYAVSCTNFR